jgi:hypothetical protein
MIRREPRNYGVYGASLTMTAALLADSTGTSHDSAGATSMRSWMKTDCLPSSRQTSYSG